MLHDFPIDAIPDQLQDIITTLEAEEAKYYVVLEALWTALSEFNDIASETE